MPPRGHSSSSHSSSSRSSSSFRSSSSSRSSGSRSYSSYSSGSRSSSYRSPSPHSSTSHSSRPVYSGGSSSPRTGNHILPTSRPRVNQPAGFKVTGNRRPSYYFGRSHDYIYYPIAWTDTSTGIAYEKGYYDENGQRYDNVAFENNGKYENVICHCPYCGQDTVLNLDADQVASQSLQCPHCSGPMEIKSQLDEALSGTAGTAEARTTAPKKRRRGWLVVAIILVALWIIGTVAQKREESSQLISQQSYNAGASSNVSLFGKVVSLVRVGDGAYAISSDGQTPDKQIAWDDWEESYYDAEADCWLWYNTDVEPPVWQYWYDRISNDFDAGWMEHDAFGWYIEESPGNWIDLPEKYSTDGLWYIVD